MINPEEEVEKFAGALKTYGFFLPTKPEKEVHGLPRDLDSFTATQLHTLMDEHTAHLNYAGYYVEVYAFEVAAHKANLSEARTRAEICSTAKTATARKLEAEIHPSVIEAQEKLLISQLKFKLLSNIYDNHKSYIYTVSRRLTTLQGEKSSFGE